MNGTARGRAGRLEKRAVMVVLRDAAARAVMAGDRRGASIGLALCHAQVGSSCTAGNRAAPAAVRPRCRAPRRRDRHAGL